MVALIFLQFLLSGLKKVQPILAIQGGYDLKVTTNTEFGIADILFPGWNTRLGSYKTLEKTFPLTETLFYAFPLKDGLFNTRCWFAHTELTQGQRRISCLSAVHQHMCFLHKAHHTTLRDPREHFRLCLGPIWTTKSPTVAQKFEKRGTKQTMKRTLVNSTRAEMWRQSWAPLARVGWERVHQVTWTAHHPGCFCK